MRRPAPPLTNWVDHHPEEPAYGLVARCVAEGVEDQAPWYFETLGSPNGHVQRIDPRRAAEYCRAEVRAVQWATPKFRTNRATLYGHTLHRLHFEFGFRRWCPDCLSEHGAHLAWWELRFVTACPRHRTALVDGCSCGQRIAWRRRVPFLQCTCGEDLRFVRSLELDEAECMADAYVVGRLTGTGRTANEFLDRFPVAAVVDALVHVGSFSLEPRYTASETVSEYGRRTVANAGFAALSHFPVGLTSVLDKAASAASRDPIAWMLDARAAYGGPIVDWLRTTEHHALARPVSRILARHAKARLTTLSR